ncbi:unnamed protein product [Ambrosiozyma monospora]|uniref:Unnamed protein product n=1 Tax=Ambrosiozyma monospora TaxID=43982 RepID=A0A9W6SZU3_AMBMO|nr:unnamed protein product [Ambrosiozyma monospora]
MNRIRTLNSPIVFIHRPSQLTTLSNYLKTDLHTFFFSNGKLKIPLRLYLLSQICQVRCMNDVNEIFGNDPRLTIDYDLSLTHGSEDYVAKFTRKHHCEIKGTINCMSPSDIEGLNEFKGLKDVAIWLDFREPSRSSNVAALTSDTLLSLHLLQRSVSSVLLGQLPHLKTLLLTRYPLTTVFINSIPRTVDHLTLRCVRLDDGLDSIELPVQLKVLDVEFGTPFEIFNLQVLVNLQSVKFKVSDDLYWVFNSAASEQFKSLLPKLPSCVQFLDLTSNSSSGDFFEYEENGFSFSKFGQLESMKLLSRELSYDFMLPSFPFCLEELDISLLFESMYIPVESTLEIEGHNPLGR